ncbi:MAG: DoxX family protein [Thiotrichaceae bacterium]|nr:DoxX family protein [Thiotrichaceae bacterium]
MFINLYFWITDKLNIIGTFLPQLGLRTLLAWEFWEAGHEKLTGDNWFVHIKDNFPYPFNIVPTEISWNMAMGFELVGAIALLIGLGTRFFSISLMILTVVAAVSVHVPAHWDSLSELFKYGYDICNSDGGNFKLPLMYMILFLPLLFSGAGKASVDYWIANRFMKDPDYIDGDIHK